MADRDFYEVLGVPPDAPQDEIQRAYRKLARTYHPDINKDPGAEDRFKEIAEAYDVLSDPDARAAYDERRRGGQQFRRQGPRGQNVDMDFDMGGVDMGGVDIDFDDLFGSMFAGRGGGRARRSWGPIAGADQEAVLEVSVEEAYRGGRRSITLAGPGGERRYDVNIPAGVVDGQRIRLAGQGGQGTAGAAAGDLYLIVRVAPHPRYRVEGRDIYVELKLAPWEAALGASVAVDTPGGEAKLRVPAGTSSGKRLRLRGRGMPNPRGKPGDLYAEVRIMVPRKLTDEERRLFEELARVSTFDPRKAK
jgi:curved DNA-binding protein